MPRRTGPIDTRWGEAPPCPMCDQPMELLRRRTVAGELDRFWQCSRHAPTCSLCGLPMELLSVFHHHDGSITRDWYCGGKRRVLGITLWRSRYPWSSGHPSVHRKTYSEASR